jgi:ABC-2 type transport system permease protein
MRLFSEEFRAGTIEPLMSSPPGEFTLVLGKFAGAAGFLLACLVPTGVYVVVLLALSNPDGGPIVAGYLGVALLGLFYLAVGTLFSTLTSSQTLAFIATLFALLLLEIGSAKGAEHLPAPWSDAANALQVAPRLADFARGLISPAHVLFFLILTGMLLGASALVLRVRRWR